MTKCDKCGEEAGNLFCGNCRGKVEKKYRKKLPKLFPLLYWDEENKCYRFGCKCLGCPCNNNGVCGSIEQNSLEMLFKVDRIHEFDEDNIIRQVCG